MIKECKYREGGFCIKAEREVKLLTCEKNCPVPADPCEYLVIDKVEVIEELGIKLPKIRVDAVCKKEGRNLSRKEIEKCTKYRYAEECVIKK